MKDNNLKYITLKLTNNCNLNCKMCGQYRENYRAFIEELNIEEVEKILTDCKSLEHVYLFGGEPLLYNQFIPLLNIIKGRKLPCRITTNGVLLSKYSKEIVKNNVRDIEISLDSHKKDVYESIRGKKVFDLVIRGIIELIEEKEKTNSQYPRIFINAVILPENYQHLLEMIEWLRKNIPQLDGINFEVPISVYPQLGEMHTYFMKNNLGVAAYSWKGFENEKLLFSENAMRDIYSSVVKIRKAGTASVKGPNTFEEMCCALNDTPNYQGKMCQYPFFTLAILPNGDATFCVDFPDYIVGNIYESTIEQIWNGKRAQTFKNCIRENGSIPICMRCPHRFEEITGEF